MDDLPQLFNLVSGEISLVGLRLFYDASLSVIYDLDCFVIVPPAKISLWQINDRYDEDYDTRVYLDAWYDKN